MLRRRVGLDVAELPTTVFGSRDLVWWGTVAFMVIEGFTLALCATVYLYLKGNFGSWPPEGILLPSRVAPTIHVLLMLASLPVTRMVDRGAHELDFRKVRLGLTIGALFFLVFAGFRAWELLQSLNVRWDANAYGSAQWLILGTHGTLLGIELLEAAGMALIFWVGPVEKKHFTDAADIAFYWYFIVLIWVPLYVLCFQLPHWV